jgi:hypothetical protein
MTLKNYIQAKKPRQYNLGHIEVIVVNPHPDDVDTRAAISMSLSKIPKYLSRNISKIKIGNFKELVDRSIQAMYSDGEIILSNEHLTVEDIVDDIVHEVAHSVEEFRSRELYSDKKIENEFLEKRKKLWIKLGRTDFRIPLSRLLDTQYSKQLDDFFYKTVGYPILRALSSDLFYSPYAATSLREYFANGFEAFFMREDLSRLKSISPELYKKITNLLEI